MRSVDKIQIRNIYPTIPATDIRRALEFYQDSLGLTVNCVLSEKLGMYLVGNESAQFLLFQRSENTKAEHTVISFTVEDVAEALNQLEQRAVEFYASGGQKIIDLDGSQSAWFKDSEGNSLEISQRNF